MKGDQYRVEMVGHKHGDIESGTGCVGHIGRPETPG